MPINALYDNFPLLQHRPLSYLDCAASAQKPAPVLAAMEQYQRTNYGPVPGGLYGLAADSQQDYWQARQQIASLVNAQTENTILTANATDSINLAVWGFAAQHLQAGDMIVLSPAEHHSNLVPWQQLAHRHDLLLRWLQLDPQGQIDLQDAQSALSDPRAKMLAVAHVSNVLGTINDVKALTDLAHSNQAFVLVDGTQAVPQIKVDVAALNCDFYAWSGHKAYGPSGIGVLHIQRPLKDIEPTVQGGHMIQSVTLQHSTWAEDHSRLEAGSPCLTEAVGLGAACQLLSSIGFDQIGEHAYQLASYTIGSLQEIGADIYGPELGSPRAGLVSFNLPGVHAHDVAEICARNKVCVKAGHHCAQPLHNEILGVAASVRASFAIHSTSQDVDNLLAALRNAQQIFA
jgi:cysteine desulfurase/selenocysteine lyase